MNPFSVTLVGNHRILLDGLLALLKNEKELAVNHASILQTLPLNSSDTVPDLIIFHYQDTDDKDQKQLEAFRKNHPHTKLLLMHVGEFSDKLHKTLDLADGFLFGNTSGSEFLHAIREVLKNRTYLSPVIMPLLLEKYQKKEMHAIAHQLFSEREKEVLEMVALDKTNDEIANELCISRRTVETHRKNMMSKANVRSVIGLIKFGVCHELIAF